jgi:PKD domain/FlgD Ig-like domain
MIHVLLRFIPAVLLLAIGVTCTTQSASAQYMFLDTNGDGLNTVGDRLPFQEQPGTYTNVDIWLETDRNRDGSPATCPSGEPLSLTSYEISLASSGSVEYGSFTNLLLGFTGPLQEVENGNQFYTHYASGLPLTPGKHHLATVQVAGGPFGPPDLQIVATNGFIPGSRTGFGSECGGPGSVRLLSVHWFDTGGLEFGSIDYYPVFAVPPLDMVVPAGGAATQAFEAVNPDGGAFLEVQIVSGPPFVSAEQLFVEYGVVRLTVSPGLADIGTWLVVVSASDGNFTVDDALTITVPPPLGVPGSVDFETPSLGDATRLVIDPYVDAATGVTFRALPSGAVNGVVGLIKNSATQCVDPSDTNQRLGTAPEGSSQIGAGAHHVQVTFPTPLQPPATVSVELKLPFTSYGELRLFDSAGNEVGFAREIHHPRLPGCGPLQFSGVQTLTAGSMSSIASAIVRGPNGMVFTIDDFRFASGVATGPPIVDAPAAATGSEGVLLSIPVLALDPDGDTIASLDADLTGLPLGDDATFTRNGSNTSGTLTWTPDYTHAGSYAVTFTASNSGGTGSATTSITIANVNLAPTADAGGPYTGVAGVPVSFSAAGSSDPDGDPLAYLWHFGDGMSGSGSEVGHAYAAAGVFAVTLEVSDGADTGQDATSATIAGFLDARAFLAKPSRTIALGSGASSVCVQLEPARGSYANQDIDLSTLVMISPGTGSVSEISAVADKTVIAGDSDQNGVDEITACFLKGDLRLLFANVHGREVVRVSLEARLTSGGTIHGEVDLTVAGSGGNLAASVYPNPLNPEATITFVTSWEGPAKVRLYSADGRLVRTLMEAPALPSGYHDVRVDGRSEAGSRLASGIYYFVVEAGERSVQGRLAIVK